MGRICSIWYIFSNEIRGFIRSRILGHYLIEQPSFVTHWGVTITYISVLTIDVCRVWMSIYLISFGHQIDNILRYLIEEAYGNKSYLVLIIVKPETWIFRQATPSQYVTYMQRKHSCLSRVREEQIQTKLTHMDTIHMYAEIQSQNTSICTRKLTRTHTSILRRHFIIINKRI